MHPLKKSVLIKQAINIVYGFLFMILIILAMLYLDIKGAIGNIIAKGAVWGFLGIFIYSTIKIFGIAFKNKEELDLQQQDIINKKKAVLYDQMNK